MMCDVVILRRELRIHDNLLFQASKAPRILPVVCLPPGIKDKLKQGHPPSLFWFESVKDLQNNLKKLGSSLLVSYDGFSETVEQLATKVDIETVICSQLVSPFEKEEESSLQATCQKLNFKFKKVWDSTLYHVEDVPICPDSFTQFRKLVEDKVPIRPTVTPMIKPLPSCMNIPDIETVKSSSLFQGGETHGLERMGHYFEKAVFTYKDTRNGLIRWDDSSKFSPWLAFGCLSPRHIYHTLQTLPGNESTYWLFFELIWRDFFKFHTLKVGSKLYQRNGPFNRVKSWKKDPRLFEAWKNGTTGIPFIDAAMREMNATGFMSNRMRQNVASFLVHSMGLDWKLGAAYFEEQLIDYDPESNYGNWQYLAGVGCDPRERVFNIIKQQYDYDPLGEYVLQWIPELGHLPLKHQGLFTPWTCLDGELYGKDPIVFPVGWKKAVHKSNVPRKSDWRIK